MSSGTSGNSALPTHPPACRELLGKYAASSNGGTQPHMPASTAGSTPFRSGGDGGHGGGATPPVPSYLSPAFQLAAMEQEVQMAHAEAAAQHSGGGGGTPGWQPDDESALEWEQRCRPHAAASASAPPSVSI